MTEQKADLLRKWVAALESGDYKQGSRRLCKVQPGSSEPEHCCLGVLCELAGLRKAKSMDFADGSYDFEYRSAESVPVGTTAFLEDSEASSAVALPASLATLMGNEDPLLLDRDLVEMPASLLNDNRGFTFGEIADCIRRTFPSVFEEA